MSDRGQLQLGGGTKPKKVKLPEVYEAKIDVKKVNLPALKAWGSRRLTELMGSEDEVRASPPHCCTTEGLALPPPISRRG